MAYYYHRARTVMGGLLSPNGLVRTTLKKAYADGTVAVGMDPLSLLLPSGHQRP